MLETAYLVVTLASHHFTGEHYNQHNYGVGVEVPVGFRISAVAGGYRNSIERNTFYAGASWTPLTLGPVHLGVLGLLASGYDKQVTMAILPTAQLEIGRWGMNMIYIPKMDSDCAVIGFQAKWKF